MCVFSQASALSAGALVVCPHYLQCGLRGLGIRACASITWDLHMHPLASQAAGGWVMCISVSILMWHCPSCLLPD